MIDWFVYVDESGDLGALGTEYFVVVALQVSNDRELGRIIKRVRTRKLKKKLVEVSEMKANVTPPEIRKAVLERVAMLDCRIYALAVDKKKITPQLMGNSNRLYNWLCRLLCQQVEARGEIRIVMDKKYNNKLLRGRLQRVHHPGTLVPRHARHRDAPGIAELPATAGG